MEVKFAAACRSADKNGTAPIVATTAAARIGSASLHAKNCKETRRFVRSHTIRNKAANIKASRRPPKVCQQLFSFPVATFVPWLLSKENSKRAVTAGVIRKLAYRGLISRMQNAAAERESKSLFCLSVTVRLFCSTALTFQ